MTKAGQSILRGARQALAHARGEHGGFSAGDGGSPHGPLFPDAVALEALCRRHHIRRLSLFGSRLRGQAREDSDVDLLVEFEAGREPGLIALAGIEAELSALLRHGRADLRTARDLSRHFRAEVLREAEVQYAA